MATVITLMLAPIPGTTPRLPINTSAVRTAVIGALRDGVSAVQVDAVDIGVLVIPALRTRLRVTLSYAAGLTGASDAASRVAQANLGVNSGAGGTWYVVSRNDNNATELVPTPRAMANPTEAPSTQRAGVTSGRVVAQSSPDPGTPSGVPSESTGMGVWVPVLAVIAGVGGVALLSWGIYRAVNS